MTPTATNILKAPFPAFGGKAQVADIVWERIGHPRNFIEHFAFGAAVLLRRPEPGPIETLNDLNSYVSNFWRAVQGDLEADAAGEVITRKDHHMPDQTTTPETAAALMTFDEWWKTVDTDNARHRAGANGNHDGYVRFMEFARAFAESAWRAAEKNAAAGAHDVGDDFAEETP